MRKGSSHECGLISMPEVAVLLHGHFGVGTWGIIETFEDIINKEMG